MGAASGGVCGGREAVALRGIIFGPHEYSGGFVVPTLRGQLLVGSERGVAVACGTRECVVGLASKAAGVMARRIMRG